MTPQLTTLAGMKSDSEGSRKDCLNEPGLEQNRMVMRMQQVMKRTMVRMRKMLPMVFRPLNLNGTEQTRLVRNMYRIVMRQWRNTYLN